MKKIAKNNKKIVVIGGGTGVFTVLSGLKHYFNNLTAILTMADDGGSTGILREEFEILPPGDIRRALVVLSNSNNKKLPELFNYRFQEGGGLSGHNLGNLIITALERITGNFEKAIEEVCKILQVRGRILPVSLKPTHLMAEFEGGQIIKGESNIDAPHHKGFPKINKVWLNPPVSINPASQKAILGADAIIIGPGDVYTSLIPNLLVSGMKQALKKSKAKIIYFVNLMTKFGETNGFKAPDFLKVMEAYLGKNIIDFVMINKTKPTALRFRPYAAEKSEFVEVDRENFARKPIPIVADLMQRRGFIRHDPEKLIKLIKMII